MLTPKLTERLQIMHIIHGSPNLKHIEHIKTFYSFTERC